MAFCSKCGKEIPNGAQFCTGCGQAAYPPQAPYQPPQNFQQPVRPPFFPQPHPLVQQLSSKIKTSAVIWILIAAFQFIAGLLNLVVGFELNAGHDDGAVNIFVGIFVILIGVLNSVMASRNLDYSQEVLANPVGIVNTYKPVGGLIGTLVYNLFFGGIIGIAGSIYAFVLRSFVMSHASQFQAIEAGYSGNAVTQN